MEIEKDKVVAFHYALTDADGKEIEQSDRATADPVVYLHGYGNILAGLEEQLTGKSAGDEVSVTLPPERAYGRRAADSLQRVPIKHLLTQHKLHKLVTQRYSIGLVTASPRRNLNWLQTLINLDELFKHIISGDETKKNKPHPEPYLIMMEKLNVKPENVVVIEDSLHGIQAALASGAAVIAKTGSVPESDLSIAHRIITHLDEITHNMIEDLLQGDK